MGGVTVVAEKKPKPAVRQTGKASIKLDLELHRMATVVAGFRGQQLTEYLEEVLGPVLRDQYAAVGESIRKGQKPTAREDR